MNKRFLNTNTVILRQLMRTARTLEAEWRQVLGRSMSPGAKKDESSTWRVWVAGFHHVTARSRLAGVLKPTNNLFIYFIFHFFSGRGELQILNQWIRGYDYILDSYQTIVSDISPLKTKFILNRLKDRVHTGSKHTPSRLHKNIQLMLCKEIIAVCTESHTKLISAICGQN
jgi:hypothetical protein